MIQKSILLVDDEEVILETISDDLKEVGYSVVSANSGAEGLRQLKLRKFDLVISDFMMDEMDGLEVLREIKRTSPQTPVIIITGYPSSKFAKEALILGASDVIIKPLGSNKIFNVVSRHIESSRRDEEKKSHRYFDN